MALGSGAVLCYVVFVVMSLKPWWEAQYIIPLLGMLLGSCTSGVSLGLTTILDELTTRGCSRLLLFTTLLVVSADVSSPNP